MAISVLKDSSGRDCPAGRPVVVLVAVSALKGSSGRSGGLSVLQEGCDRSGGCERPAGRPL